MTSKAQILGIALRLALAATATATILVGPVYAAPIVESTTGYTTVVASSDLDLASTGGQAVLRERVQRAASEVCAAATEGMTMRDPPFRDCYTQALNSGLSQAKAKIAAARPTRLEASAAP